MIMKKITDKLFSIGVKEEYPQYLSSKIIMSNILTLIVGVGIAIPYIVISYLYFRPITIIPAIATIICLLIFLFNYLNFINVSRLTLSLLPLSMALIFIAYLVPKGGVKLYEMYAVSISFSMVAFIVFDIREKWYLIFCSIIIVVVNVFALDWLNAIFEKDLDTTIVTEGYLGQMNIFLGTTVLILIVTTMAYQNYTSDKRSEMLIVEMDKQTQDIKQSENELKEKMLQIEKSQIEEQKRNWATKGIAEVSTILRSENDSKKLYDRITTYITEYLNANQGGLFMVESDEYGENIILKLQSCYAYNRKKFIEKEIAPGQGLIGQAYLEKSSIYLKDVPNDYASITSGLGESTPKEVLIVPLIVNDEVEGIYEFASFKKFEEHQIQFLEQLGESLAAFINVNRINEKTKYLLEESQQQTEEMRSQEEEMRQNMEELSATQEEMARKEQEYLNQIDELKTKLEKSGLSS